MPTIEKKRNIHINFSDITFQKCKDPDHSHPPLSQRENVKDLDKIVNSDLNNYFVINEYQNYFDFTAEYVFEKSKNQPKFLLKHFPPSRGPPILEV